VRSLTRPRNAVARWIVAAGPAVLNRPSTVCGVWSRIVRAVLPEVER